MKKKIVWKLEDRGEIEKTIESYPEGYGFLEGILEVIIERDEKLGKFEVKELKEEE